MVVAFAAIVFAVVAPAADFFAPVVDFPPVVVVVEICPLGPEADIPTDKAGGLGFPPSTTPVVEIDVDEVKESAADEDTDSLEADSDEL